MSGPQTPNTDARNPGPSIPMTQICPPPLFKESHNPSVQKTVGHESGQPLGDNRTNHFLMRKGAATPDPPNPRRKREKAATPSEEVVPDNPDLGLCRGYPTQPPIGRLPRTGCPDFTQNTCITYFHQDFTDAIKLPKWNMKYFIRGALQETTRATSPPPSPSRSGRWAGEGERYRGPAGEVAGDLGVGLVELRLLLLVQLLNHLLDRLLRPTCVTYPPPPPDGAAAALVTNELGMPHPDRPSPVFRSQCPPQGKGARLVLLHLHLLRLEVRVLLLHAARAGVRGKGRIAARRTPTHPQGAGQWIRRDHRTQ